jgi:hypothetical protein
VLALVACRVATAQAPAPPPPAPPGAAASSREREPEERLRKLEEMNQKLLEPVGATAIGFLVDLPA